MKRAASSLNYANITATIALMVAIGTGGAFAASTLGPKTVGERQLRPGAVTQSKLRKNAVTAPKIKSQAVKQGKIADGAVSAAKVGAGAVSTAKLGTAAVTNEKIADNAVTGQKVDESTLGKVPFAGAADSASFAESGNPAAFAAVGQEGDVDGSISKGVGSADVKVVVNGVYCITVPGFSPRGAQVTPQYNGSGTVNAFVTIGGTGSCAAPKVEVQTYNGGVLIKEPYYIAFYR